MQDHEPDNPSSEYPGAHGVASSTDFCPEMFENTDVTSEDYNHPFGKLLLFELWPGDWKAQYSKYVIAIREGNKHLPKNKHVKEPTIDEWWHLWGIIILSGKLGVGGGSPSFMTNRSR